MTKHTRAKRFLPLIVWVWVSLCFGIQDSFAKTWLENLDAKIFAGLGPSQIERYNSGIDLYKAGKKAEALSLFQLAASGGDKSVRAKALGNSALIQIEGQNLKAARDDLRKALAFDNGNKALEENLAWVETRLKDAEPKDQNQKQNEQKKEDEKEKKEKEKEQEQKTQKDQQDSSKQDASKDKEKDKDKSKEQQQSNKDGDKKDQKEASSSEGKDDKKEKQSSAAESKEDEKQTNDEPKPTESKGKESKPPQNENNSNKDDSPPVPSSQAKPASLVTPEEIKIQEAERVLRSIDDKIGRYPLSDTDATLKKRGRDSNDKDW